MNQHLLADQRRHAALDTRGRRGVPTGHVLFGEGPPLAGDRSDPASESWRGPGGRRFAAAKIRVSGGVDAIGTQGDRRAGGGPRSGGREDVGEQLVLSSTNKTSASFGRRSRSRDFSGATAKARSWTQGRAGLAFQIKDDLLDVEADSATLGKAAGKDAAAGKATFPGIWGVDRSRAKLREQVEQAIEFTRSLPERGGRLPELARYVEERFK